MWKLQLYIFHFMYFVLLSWRWRCEVQTCRIKDVTYNTNVDAILFPLLESYDNGTTNVEKKKTVQIAHDGGWEWQIVNTYFLITKSICYPHQQVRCGDAKHNGAISNQNAKASNLAPEDLISTDRTIWTIPHDGWIWEIWNCAPYLAQHFMSVGGRVSQDTKLVRRNSLSRAHRLT